MPIPVSRRTMITGAGACALVAPTAGFANTPTGNALDFVVRRNNGNFGSHRIEFSGDASRLTVKIAIELQVRAAFINLFRYSHSNTEVWENGQLTSIETQTVDNGDEFRLSGKATPEGFKVMGEAGEYLAPSEIIPTSYWHPATPYRSQLLDTQKGRLFSVAANANGNSIRPSEDGSIVCRSYEMTGDLDLNLFYTDNSVWAGCAFEIRGSRIDYLIADLVDAPPLKREAEND